MRYCCLRIRMPRAKDMMIAVLSFGCVFIFQMRGLNIYFSFACMNLKKELNIIYICKIQFTKNYYKKKHNSLNPIPYTMQNQPEQNQQKIKFSQQQDHSTQKMNTILTTIQKQQEQILQLLSKYKKAIPEDQYEGEERNQLNRSAFVKGDLGLKMGDERYCGKLTNKSGSRTIPVKKLSASVAKDKYSEYISNGDGKKLEKSKFDSYLGEARKKLKLPSVYDKVKKKQQFQLEHEKVDKKYNENVIKFYEGLSARNQGTDRIIKKEQLNKSKQKSNRKKHKKIESLLILNPQLQSGTQGAKLNIRKFQNIFEPDQQNQAENLIGMEHQISKPIAYRPYSDPLQYLQQKETTKQSRTNSKISKIQNDDEEKPVEVSMTYYIRTFNEKWREQCQQEINYLYFSKGDEEDSNKQWAEEVIKMFERHDNDLTKFHNNMRYLQTFDEAFFTAGIYQGTQANKKGY